MVATLDGLIHQVREQADDELVQLERASQLSEELGELADSLLTYFVDRCRVSGRTWAEIGAHLGVTRQAARKRFVDTVGDGVTLERFTMRARHALDRAGEVAGSMHHNYVGTEHQPPGQMNTAAGIAALALADLRISSQAVAAEITAAVGDGPSHAPGPRPLTPRARKVLEEAVNVSLDLGHNYVGTEHLLLGL